MSFKKNNIRLNAQSEDLERKTIAKISSDLQSGITDITQEVAKATAVTDRVTELESQVEALGTSKNELLAKNQLLKEKVLHLEIAQKKYNLTFYGICEMKGMINEEINNLLENMFSNEDVHTEIRCNQITLNSTYNKVTFNVKLAIMMENVCTKYTTYTYKYIALNQKPPITKQNLHIFFLL